MHKNESSYTDRWINRSINPVVFGILGGILFFIFILNMLRIHVPDSDMYFLIASGREIINKGIIHNNVWTIDSSSGIVIQQWLYCIIVSYVDRFGIYGLYAFVFSEIVLFGLVLFAFFRNCKISRITSLLMICVILTVSQAYLFSIRPEIITIILLLSECIIIEKYQTSNKVFWLALLPVIFFLEINLHASMWPMHLAVILAYFVPSFYCDKVNDRSIFKKKIPLLGAVVASILALFVNPYGIKSIGYPFMIFSAKTSQYVPVLEMQLPYLLSTTSLIIIICCIMIVFAFRKGKLTSVSLHMSLGLMFMSIFMVRNMMFAPVMITFLLRDVFLSFDGFDKTKVVLKEIKNYVYPFIIVGIIAGVVITIITVVRDTESYCEQFASNISSACDYLDNNAKDENHIFTGFNTGAYLEYRGFKNIYIDARPELFTSNFTGGKNILRDYSRICAFGYSRVNDDLPAIVSGEEIDRWLEEYDFDYLIVQPNTERVLFAHLISTDTYHIVDSASCDEVLLFERTK